MKDKTKSTRRVIELGHVGGLRLSTRPSAVISSVGLWVLLGLLGRSFLRLNLMWAVVGGLLATLLHWVSDLVHQFGHAFFARQAGFPMRGIICWGLLSSAIYPRDEGDVAADIHIFRALGGPVVSLLLTLLAGVGVWLTRPFGGLPWYLLRFTFWDNLLVFTLGALLPLKFTDGSTLLTWWPQRRSKADSSHISLS